MPACVRKYACLRPFLALLTACCCLFLPGCGTKLPDSGSLPSVAVGEDTPFYLEVSTEDIQKKGLRAEGLAPAIEQQLLSVDGMKLADKPGPGTLAVRVDVREVYQAGKVRKNYLKRAGKVMAGAVVGALGGALFGATQVFDHCCCGDSSTFLLSTTAGALVGSVTGAALTMDDRDPGEIWAMRAGVGIAWDETPDTLEEIVVSTGTDGVSSREEAVDKLEGKLAQRINDAISVRPSS